MSVLAPRILIVDDDAVTRRILTGYLTRAGYATTSATDGDEALEGALREPPALILLDLVLPGPDGYEVLRRLRDATATRDVPIVVLTALEGDEEIEHAFELGADDFVRKPFRATELLARIRSQLRLHGYLVELSQKERDAQAMVELTQTLASSLDFREILYTVVRRIAEVVKVDRCSIIVGRPDGELGHVLAASDDAGVQNLPIELGRYPEVQRVLQTRAPLTIDDVERHPVLGAVKDSLTERKISSLTLLPIAYQDRAHGVMFLRAAGGRGRLTEPEIRFCQVVANATAVALRNARVLQELREETQAMSTARAEAEQQVHALERYMDLFMSASDGMVVIDYRGRTRFSNPRAHEILGYTPEELQTLSAVGVVPEFEHGRARAVGLGFFRGEFPQHLDFTVRRKDGALRVLSLSFSSLLKEQGAVLVTFRDVTEDRETARELRRTKDFLSALIESSPDAIVAADVDGAMLVWNTAAERICGLPRDVVLARSLTAVYPPGVAQDILRRLRESASIDGLRTEVLSHDGDRIPILLAAAIVREGGRESGTVGIFSDLRERLKMEERLMQAQQQLALSEKQAVIAELAGAAAHELSQPLTSIMGYAELVKRRVPAESPACHAADVIIREAERMAEIVRKIGRITHYETKEYVGGTNILDLDRAATPSDKPRR